MYTIDDPMFALILRFIGQNQKVTFCDHEFFNKQLKAIQEHVEKFPPEEKELRAIEWIEKCARKYRERWENEIVGMKFSNERCPDCPLSNTSISGHCQIHEQWLELLQKYSADKINAKVYVENALELVAQHKDDLKRKLTLSEDRV